MTKTNNQPTLTPEQYESKLNELLEEVKKVATERFEKNNVESYYIEIDDCISEMDRHIFRGNNGKAKNSGIAAIALISNHITLKIQV